ncbi:acetoacetate decarboxylase [Streptomyces gibsoniae]|uniref:Acetoacetate decarboxylase n=1 Tax=Streptomyces gibsoniae TaxID=3075529 RepID=A0ABU2U3E8_9ACTN|nr:acetoacetate decarboxylase [Streptomyces sp. DSM 41699]MDT0467735.1 acetoacetate decarboxylase [Streptomyces sp. DSM 41699]
MKIEDVRLQINTPLPNQAYPPVMARFTDREYLNIVYRTDADALRAVVPEPLQIDEREPLVRFEIMRMNEVTAYGPYTEGGLVVPVTFEGEPGEYLHSMYLDSFPATVAGRELSAYPKVIGAPKLYVDGPTLVGTIDFGTLRVATATMGYKHYELDKREAEAQITVPTFMLKTVPGYDGAPRVQELVRTQITDVVVKEAYTGPARLQLFQHALAPLADLPVLEVVSASHINTDLTLAPVKPVFNYLTEEMR